MALIKTINLDQTEIEFYDDYIPTTDEKKRENLIKVYDTINDISQILGLKKTKSWFITKNQLKNMKKSNKYNFL
jgi:hypothetical protein